jgi:hypothetical protein
MKAETKTEKCHLAKMVCKRRKYFKTTVNIRDR